MEPIKLFTNENNTMRLKVFVDEYAEHPLDFFSLRLHVQDFSREYTLEKRRNLSTSSNIRSLICHLLTEYGDRSAMVEELIANGKREADERKDIDCFLEYTRSRSAWTLYKYVDSYGHGGPVAIEDYECTRRWLEDVLYDILEEVTDQTLEAFMDSYLLPRIKVCAYSFDYEGGVNFSDRVTCDADGLAWLLHDEVVGDGKELTEEDWQQHTCQWCAANVIEYAKAWSRGEVYTCVLEKRVAFHVTKVCTSEERETQEYDTEEWEVEDSLGGFYGDLSRNLSDFCSTFGIEENLRERELDNNYNI